MRPLFLGLCTLAVWASSVLPASAAWDNVFQPTLFHRQGTVAQYYAPRGQCSTCAPTVAAAAPCPTCAPQVCQSCTTNYVQRCFYQPVTTYQSQSYYEAVTSYQTSYYYEPVTSYRYSCYYDPGSCSYQQVATPCTS